MNKNHEEIIMRLREPFGSKDIDWKVQVTTQDKGRGMAAAYLDARAVQKRLDEVVGAFNWKNVYSLWHNNSQICGISIFNAERNEWVTKFDGAENSEIEPIKGGLSDSFKRAASAWGIGRYLYEMEGIWVDIESKGKSSVIKQDQSTKLENEYNAAVSKIFNNKAASDNKAPTLSVPESVPENVNEAQPPESSAYDYTVQSVKPSGKSSQMVEFIDGNGGVIMAYIKTGDKAIVTGSRLRRVQMERKSSDFGEYNLISEYQLAA
jgi:hypothetical protein